MQRWLSFHFYPLEVPDVFLARAVRPFLEQHVWPIAGARAFFIRYDDEKGRHIRLRIRGEEEWLDNSIRPALKEWMAERGEWTEVPYEAETERFGGPEALAWAEEYFHISSRVALDRLNREYSYGDAMFDALRMHTVAAHAAGFTRNKAAWYFGRLTEQWFSLFFQSPEGQAPDASAQAAVFGQFAKSLAPQETAIRYTIEALWKSLDKKKYDLTQPEWLRWIHGNQLILPSLGDKLDVALPSLLHLTNNRLGINNQDEVYVNYILWKTM